jgi:RHS repeat-associated protein
MIAGIRDAIGRTWGRIADRIGKSVPAALLLPLLLGGFALPAQAGCVSGRCASPSLTISAPADHASFRAGQDITLTGRAYGDVVYANDGDGRPFPIERVDIYRDGSVVGTANLGPTGHDQNDIPYRDFDYTFVGGFAVPGNYVIGGKPFDTGSNTGAAAGSLITRTVTIAANASPSVSVTSPANNAVVTVGSAVSLQASAGDADGTVASVQFFDYDKPLSGLLTTAPYSATWTAAPLISGGIHAIAIDNKGAATRSPGIVLTVNDKPMAQLHVSNVVTQNPGSITLSATASDSVGGLDRVEYLRNDKLQSSPAGGAPYTQSWTGIASGTYSIVARVFDTYGAYTDSAPYIWVVNGAPEVSIRGPADNTVSVAPGSFSFNAQASDADGSVANVRWFADGAPISDALTGAPYSFAWNGVGSGSYRITARATDNTGAVTTSAPITVISNDAPALTLNTSTANGTAPGSITLQASASDAQGGVSRVEYFANGSAISPALTAAPYRFDWSGVVGGNYRITARATDAYGTGTDTAPFSWLVVPANNAAPTVSLTAPANGSVINSGLPATVALAATAADSDGSVAKVEFLVNDAVVASATAAPFSGSWVANANGAYILHARATDNGGAITSSAAVTINVGVNVPPISSGSGTPGKVGGTLAVASGGTAQYTIPIVIPPGTAGMAPSIALKYESNAGNGVAGTGWSIAGLSQITRCARDLAHDGVTAGVELSANDRFCLDEQRLVVVSGTYGAADSEYRTEVDNFTRIIALGRAGNGPASFLVMLRDGTKLEYGNSADSRLVLPGHSTPIAWSTNKVYDPSGNHYTASYVTVAGTGQQLPSRIDYTGNVLQAPATATYNSVRFSYDKSRTDIEVGYVAGARVRNTARLTQINTYAGATAAKSYRLAYSVSASTARSRVDSVTECAGTGAAAPCLAPTVFRWEDTPANFSGTVVDYPTPKGEFGELAVDGDYGADHWADLNGDGRPDHCVVIRRANPLTGDYNAEDLLCSISRPNGQAPAPLKVATFSPMIDYAFIDINGDGIVDVCGDDSCTLGSAAGPGATRVRAPGQPSRGQFGFWLDFNGDARIDYCRVTNDGVNGAPYRLDCYAGDGAGFGAATNLGAVPVATCGPSTCQTVRFAWADVTGDGIQSFCRIDGSAVRCRKWTPGGLAAETSSGTIDLGEKTGRAWVDVNGDGMADFCRAISDNPGQTGGNGHLACTLSSGTGFGDTIESARIDIGVSALNSPTKMRTWVDVNGDGKVDYCRIPGTGSSTECIMSTGSGFSGTVTAAVGVNHSIVDTNADGKADACNVADGHARCLTARGTLADLLLEVSDGLGAVASVTYGPLSDPTLYAKGSGALFPSAELQDTTHVVQRVRASDGVGGMLDTTYNYEGARVHLHGRGFLGFGATSSTDPNGTVTRSVAMQEFPYTGLTRQTMVSNGGVILTDTAVTYEALGSAPYQVFPTRTVAKTNDLNGAFINWIETSTAIDLHDLSGNPLQVDTVYKDAAGKADGYSQTVFTEYQNDAINWIHGRPIKQLTVSSIPGKGLSLRAQTASYFTANPGLGQLKQSIVEPDNGKLGVTNLRLVTDFTYDKFGNVLSKTVSGANIATRTVATHGYDRQGRGPMTVKNALGHIDTYTYDWNFGQPASLTGPNQLKTSWGYDPFGRKVSEHRADGTLTTFDYNRCAACVPGSVYSISQTETVAASDATAAPPSRAYYDMLGRAILRVHAGFDGQEVYRATRYDRLGNVGQASMNYLAGDSSVRWSGFHYDPLGRVTRRIAPDQTTADIDYNGRTTSTTNTNSVTSGRSVNSQGQVVAITDAAGTADASSVAYEYDHWGNLSKTTDAAGNVTTMDYDLLGRRTRLVDPDMGTWNDVVDNLGQVTSRTDAKTQATSYTYDLLGRMTRRLGPDLDSRWYYEANAAGVSCAKGIGKLCEATASNGYFRRYGYDSKGRRASQTSHVDADYAATWDYDAAGRLSKQTFPATVAAFATPLAVSYNYTTLGVLQSITNNATSAAYWVRDAENADGALTSEAYGNGLVGTRGYDPVTGQLLALRVGSAAAPRSVQDQTYHFDGLGRLDERKDLSVGTSETFGYDQLNRLTTATITAAGSGTLSSQLTFNAIGNITSKTGVGTYAYPAAGAARPHAVASVSGTVNGVVNPRYRYDGNGNMETDGARRFTWTSFNMPATLTKDAQGGSPGAGTSTFLYGPEHQRVRQTWEDAASKVSTIYLSELQFEKEINTQTGVTNYRHYVSVGTRVVAIQTRKSNGAEDVRYLHPDHLGSTSVVTDAAGAVVDRQAFDPWGDRRVAAGASAGAADPTNAIQPTSTTRGFTGHEQLDRGNMGLVHMNGRVYDPTLARFISADPYVQSPYSSQSLNRYSYVWNAPLDATDPSGFVPIVGTVVIIRPPPAAGFTLLCRGAACASLMGSENNRLVSLERKYETALGNDGKTQWVRHTVKRNWVSPPPRKYAKPDQLMSEFIGFDVPTELGKTYLGATDEQLMALSIAGVLRNPAGVVKWLKKSRKGPIHHVCTNKNCIDPVRGGPWTPRFESIFEKAGMTLDDALNKIEVPGHFGPHPELYHQTVLDRVESAVEGLEGAAYKTALKTELESLGKEAATPGTLLNRLLTEK